MQMNWRHQILYDLANFSSICLEKKMSPFSDHIISYIIPHLRRNQYGMWGKESLLHQFEYGVRSKLSNLVRANAEGVAGVLVAPATVEKLVLHRNII